MRLHNKLVFFLLMIALVQAASPAQVLIPRDSLNKVLTSAGKKISDIQLPVDDKLPLFNKVSALNQISHNPTQSLELAEGVVGIASSLKSDKTKDAIQKIMSLLELREYQPFKLDGSLPNDYTSSKLGVDINQKGDFLGSKIMRQYVSALLLAQEYLFKDPLYSDTKEISRILSFADSLKYLYTAGTNTNKSDFCSSREKFEASLQSILVSSGITDSTHLNSIAISLIETINKINAAVKANFDIYKTGLKTSVIETELGLIAVGGFGDDTYNGNFFMIVDLGGNDTYVSNNGISAKELIISPARLIVDFSGDDAYIGGDYCFASSAFGISILMDLGGNDSYSAANHSLSSSLCGFSYLYDGGGNDLYSSRQFSVASSVFGISLFIDNSGNDIYRSSEFSQGFAFSRSFSLLSDFAGDDTYIAFNQKSNEEDYQPIPVLSQGASTGYPLIAYGGFGVLADFAGSDNYLSGRCSQAFAYANSFAALIDLDGDDKYQAGALSHASGGHFSSAILLDKSGSDYYISPENSCGFGFDIGHAMFIDESGNDSYLMKEDGTTLEDPFSFSFMIDLAGTDVYPLPAQKDGTGLKLKYINGKLMDQPRNIKPLGDDFDWEDLYYFTYNNQLLVKPLVSLNDINAYSPAELSEMLCAIPSDGEIFQTVPAKLASIQDFGKVKLNKLGCRSSSTLKALRDAVILTKGTGSKETVPMPGAEFNQTTYLRKLNSLYLSLPIIDTLPLNILIDASAAGLLYKSLIIGYSSKDGSKERMEPIFSKGETVFDRSLNAYFRSSEIKINQINTLNNMNPDGSALISSSIKSGLASRPPLNYQELKTLLDSDLEQAYKVQLLLSFDYASLDKKQLKSLKSMFKRLPSSLRSALQGEAVKDSKMSKNLETLIDIKSSDKKRKA